MKIFMSKSWILIYSLLIGLSCLVGSANGARLSLVSTAENYQDLIGGNTFTIVHYKNGKEDYDLWDAKWETAPPLGWNSVRLGSEPYGFYLIRDVRPVNSITPVDLLFKTIFEDTDSGFMICDVLLLVSEINPLLDDAFNGKPITFQQNSLSGNPSEIFPVFDLRRAYALNGCRVTLYDPNGSTHKLNRIYNDGETDWKGVVRFDRYLADLNDDKVVDIKDLALLVGNWMQEGFALIGDLSGEFGIPDGRVDLLDLAVMAEEWGVRFVKP